MGNDKRPGAMGLGVQGAVYRLLSTACERARQTSGSHRWWRDLPAAWRGQVVEPIAFRVYREPDLAAERVFGRDEDGQVCFYAHRYLRPLGKPGRAAAQGERVSAWRLIDQRWLIHRVPIYGEELAGRGFYTFSASPPV
ncbi:MAG: hypothetical protein JNJ44_12210 [Zoogloeaceae bacterium]|nr:hypothetical protein [Zoogloeaceae bacterium]